MEDGSLIEQINRVGTRYFTTATGEVVSKECRKCNEVKNMREFSRGKAYLGGRRIECKKCQAKYDKGYRQDNRGQKADYDRSYRKENRERYSDYYRKWRIQNPEKVRIKNQRRGELEKILPNTLTSEEQESILAHSNNSCILTGSTEFDFDHVIPFSTGHGGSIIGNIIPLRSDLNHIKSSSNIFEWFTNNHERLGLETNSFSKLIDYLSEMNGLTTEEYEKYVNWCHDNPRSVEQILSDNNAHGFKKPSLEIWRSETLG